MTFDVANPKGLLGIESVTYGVEDVAQCVRFFSDFGLDALERGRHGHLFATGEQTTIELRETTDPLLAPALEPGPTMREVVWGVDSRASLEALATDLARDRPVVATSDGTIHTVDPTGYAVGFRVTARKPVVLPPVTLNTIGEIVRINARSKFYDRARPQHLGHVVWYAPNYEEALTFYTQRLGFWISDEVAMGTFLRCSSDHHNLFLLNQPRTGLNHVSFGVENLDEIMGGFELLSREGWEPVWGPGRHFNGSNLFYYFANPAGGNVEYYADMDCILDQDVWEMMRGRHTKPIDYPGWGQRPSKRWDAQFRRRMAAEADAPETAQTRRD